MISGPPASPSLTGWGMPGEMYGDAAEYHSQGDACKDGHQIGVGESFGFVSDHFGNGVDSFFGAYYLDAVAHLQDQIGTCHQFKSGTQHTGNGYTVSGTYV